VYKPSIPTELCEFLIRTATANHHRELLTIFIIAGRRRYGVTRYAGALAWNWLASELDGKYVGTDNPSGDPGGYATFGEIHSNHPAQVGIMVHELGHDISWPDLYDVDNSSSGVGYWSVMGGGSWGGLSYAGDSPALPDAWLKYYQGWITPTIAANGQTYTLDQASTTGKQLLSGRQPGRSLIGTLVSNRGAGEYFLVENRQYSATMPPCLAAVS
jgi:M6 family metalloprotease-like protein